MIEYVDLLGAPFAYGGRGPKVYDCYGLVMELNRRLGRVVPDYRSPSEREAIAAIFIEQKQLWQKVDREVGALVLFRVKNFFCHCGLVVDEFHFVHTWEESGGVLIERLDKWEQRIEGYYRYVG